MGKVKLHSLSYKQIFVKNVVISFGFSDMVCFVNKEQMTTHTLKIKLQK